jgi:hypothetical protein
VFRYWSNKAVELLFDSKRRFREVFLDEGNLPLFEISVCLSSTEPGGTIGSDPTLEGHHELFKKVFEDMEKEIFKNSNIQLLVYDFNDLFFDGSTTYTR